MSDAEFSELLDLIDKASGRVTFDSARDITKPCFRCRRSDVPRTLEKVGVWSVDVYGGMRAGDPITRPMCGACMSATRTTQAIPQEKK